MLVKDFITKELPVLKSFDSGAYALALMDDFKLKHLPLVEGSAYRSLVTEKELLAMPDPQAAIGEAGTFAPSIREEALLYEALAQVVRYGLTLLPVVDGEGRYAGAVTRDKLVDALAELCHAEEEGSLVVLEVAPQDYSLTEIARLVESNRGHVMSLLTRIDRVSGRLLVLLKIDLEDASPVIRSFERFNYSVLYHSMEGGVVDEQLQERMNEVLYYMNL